MAAMIPRPGESSGEWWDATFLHDVPQPVVDDLFARGVARGLEGRSASGMSAGDALEIVSG